MGFKIIIPSLILHQMCEHTFVTILFVTQYNIEISGYVIMSITLECPFEKIQQINSKDQKPCSKHYTYYQNGYYTGVPTCWKMYSLPHVISTYDFTIVCKSYINFLASFFLAKTNAVPWYDLLDRYIKQAYLPNLLSTLRLIFARTETARYFVLKKTLL